MKGIKPGIEEAPVHYFTMGEERWKPSRTWPPDATATAFYLGQDHKLTATIPSKDDGKDVYHVDLAAGTGEQTRWYTLVGRPLTDPYPDREEQDQKLLVYTSAPLAADMEVTGHPLIHLFVSADTNDATLFVYLEDLNESGNVSYVTEGMLRAIDYPLSQDTPPYHDPVPFRTYTRQASKALTPGNVTPLRFDLLPTSYLFKKGHHLRVTISGADRDYFAQLPGPPPTLNVWRNSTHPSHLILPIITGIGTGNTQE